MSLLVAFEVYIAKESFQRVEEMRLSCLIKCKTKNYSLGILNLNKFMAIQKSQ